MASLMCHKLATILLAALPCLSIAAGQQCSNGTVCTRGENRGYIVDSELTGRFLCGIPLECLTYPLNEIRTEIFTPIEADLKAYECRSPFPRLYTIYVPSNSPRYIYIIEGSNNWIYADFLDIGEYNATVSVCLNAGGRYFCFGQTIELGSVRLIVGANSKRLFPHGGHYYLDSKADHDNVDDISVAL